MSMRPEDVQATRFREGWRGYDEGEVDDFMSRVGHALQVLISERDEAVTRAEELAREAHDVQENERLLQRTLLTAERTAEETVQRAETEAEQIRSEARADAERIRISARDRARHELQQAAEMADRIRRSVEEFRDFRDAYRNRLRVVVSEQLEALDRVGDLPDLPDRARNFDSIELVGSDGTPVPREQPSRGGSSDGSEPAPSVLELDDLDAAGASPLSEDDASAPPP